MKAIFVMVVLVFSAPACVPWTVVPIEDDAATAAPTSEPKAYVDSIWESRLLPAAARGADIFEQRPAVGAPVLVKGRARVIQHDTSSRTGRLLVDFEPADGEADAAILTGPVILGTALRDAAGFIGFTDFTNQLAFADVSNELNQRVLDTVIAPLDLAALPGKTLCFHGAWLQSGGAMAEIVPVSLEVE
jgi:predicted lipoprotein